MSRKTNNNYNKIGVGVKTRSQVQISVQSGIKEKKSNVKMANYQPDLTHILALIAPFDGKRDKNIKFYLDQFEKLISQIEVTEEFKLNILKAKFVGEAREKLATDEGLNSEDKFDQFKLKVIEIFEKKESFTDAQTKFHAIKQKPNQKISDFIKEFNEASVGYLNASGQAQEQGASKFFELIKINKFLEAISPNLSLELRKLDIKEFSGLCDKAKTIENALNLAASEQINAVNMSSDSFCDNLLKINSEQTAIIGDLKKELNNLKLKETENNENKRNSDRYCHICSRENHDTAQCYYNLKNRQSREMRSNNDFFAQPAARFSNGFGYVSGALTQPNECYFQSVVPQNYQSYANNEQYNRRSNNYNYNGSRQNFQQEYVPPTNRYQSERTRFSQYDSESQQRNKGQNYQQREFFKNRGGKNNNNRNHRSGNE